MSLTSGIASIPLSATWAPATGSESSLAYRQFLFPAVVALLTAGFILWTYGELIEATAASWQDTEAFLAHSLYIAEHGGLLGFLRECFTGVFPITERHPLYMLFLAPFSSRTAEFFWTAKIVDLITGVVTLLTLIWMVLRRYGRGPALIAGLLYAVSQSLVTASSQVNHDVLFTLCALWTWWFLTAPDASSSSIPADRAGDSVEPYSGMPAAWSRWALAGVWLGLAYLVKSPASLMGVAATAAGMWYGRISFLWNPRLWILILFTALVSSPLLVRNVLGFGTLVYEGVNSSIMWIDEWKEMGAEHSITYYDNYGVMYVEKNGYPTAADYFRTHSAGQIGERLLLGFKNEFTEILPKALSTVPVVTYGLAVPWGTAVLAFALAGLWLRRKSWDATLVVFWSASFMLFFSWNHTFDDIRFFAPLVPLWIAFAAFAMWKTAEAIMNAKNAWRVVVAVTGAVVLLGAGRTVAGTDLGDRHPIVDITPSHDRLISWFNSTIVEGDRVLIGPTTEFQGLLWMVHRPISVIRTPHVDSLEAYQRYLRERNVRYVVMHAENMAGTDGSLREALEPYFGLAPDGSIVEKARLPGWRPVFQDEGLTRHFIIYEAEAVVGLARAPN